jgi:hypothetical protein
VAGTCECGNEPSGSIKCGEFLDWLLKKDSAPWSQYVTSKALPLQAWTGPWACSKVRVSEFLAVGKIFNPKPWNIFCGLDDYFRQLKILGRTNCKQMSHYYPNLTARIWRLRLPIRNSKAISHKLLIKFTCLQLRKILIQRNKGFFFHI